MCTVGGPMADIKMKKLKTKRYKCMDCETSLKVLEKSNMSFMSVRQRRRVKLSP